MTKCRDFFCYNFSTSCTGIFLFACFCTGCFFGYYCCVICMTKCRNFLCYIFSASCTGIFLFTCFCTGCFFGYFFCFMCMSQCRNCFCIYNSLADGTFLNLCSICSPVCFCPSSVQVASLITFSLTDS